MKFQEGQSGNPNGRPKGSKDKATKALRERLEMLIDEIKFDQLVKDINSLKPKERIDAFLGLAEFVLPKLNRVTLAGDPEKPIDIHSARRALIDKLSALPDNEN